MTIFQKMLFVPVLSLILYSAFMVYGHVEHKKTIDKIESIRDHYFPLLELVNTNSQLFEELRGIFKDAVLAGESNWLNLAFEIKEKIEKNLLVLDQHPLIVDQPELNKTRENFSKYYSNVQRLASRMISNKKSLLNSTELILKVEHFHNSTLTQFSNLKKSIQIRFRATIDDASYSMNQMLFGGMVISTLSMILLIVITLMVSLSTRKNLTELVIRMKEFALGSSDFSRRIEHSKNDEVGMLIHWFNKLSDKLEQDYINLETISITDKLTQLNNRTRTDSYFPEALKEANKTKTILAAVILDIDHFKAVNDNHGHLVGDNILKSLANILKKYAQQHDFVARWGGEEFIILLKNTDGITAYERMNKLRSIIEKHNFEDVDQITASFGISLALDNDNPETLMERADKCLYAAKEKGRNCVVIES